MIAFDFRRLHALLDAARFTLGLVEPPPPVASCGCNPRAGIYCDWYVDRSDYAARKYQSYAAAKDTINESVKYHEWSLADFRCRQHLAVAAAELGA